MQVEERIARIESNDPGSHLGIPFSHVSARITIKYRVDTLLGVGGGTQLIIGGQQRVTIILVLLDTNV
jgi:hypothetical protein